MRGVVATGVISVALAWFWLSPLANSQRQGSQHEAEPPLTSSPPVPVSHLVEDILLPVRVEAELSNEPPVVQQVAVFSGWVVDTLGNPGTELLVKVWPLHEVVTGNRPSEHGCSTEADGAFRIELPASWHNVVLGVAVSSDDHMVSALLVARAAVGQTLVVSGPSDPANRLDGVVRIRGPLEQGIWLLPVEQARALVAGGDFDSATIRLGDVALNLKRPAWQDGAFGLAVLSKLRAPAAYRRFANAVALSGWLAGQPEIVVTQCAVHVPAIGGQEVSQIEFGLLQVPQFGVVWWGTADVADERVEICAESGTAFAIIGKTAGGQGLAIGRCIVEGGKTTEVEWTLTLPGPHEVDVPIDLSLADGVRQLDVQAVPILEGGVRVQSRRAWRTARGLVKDPTTHPFVVRLAGMAEGRYELQVVVGRRVLASADAIIPGDVPILAVPSQASVVFALPLAGRTQAPFDVCYVLDGSTGAPSTARLPTGIGGFEGFALQRVPPGDYRFCLRYEDRYAEGRFTVESGAKVVCVPVDEQAIEWVEGLVDGVGADSRCVVSVVAPHVVAPWLSVETNEHGAFRLGVPLRYLDRGLSARLGGTQCHLQQSSVGRWTRRD